MEITEVRIKLMEDAQERLQAFCSITIDGAFVVRDLKIIKGTKGPFVAMPSRKLTDRCPRCGTKNNLRAMYCNQCGLKLNDERAMKGQDGRAKLYADIAHPINCDCREQIQYKVLAAFDHEQELSKQPGYICRYDDYGEESYGESLEDWELPVEAAHRPPRSLPAAAPAAVRRIEPATLPAGPHRVAAGGECLVSQPAVASGESSRCEEEFGSGLV